jgi:hypothetical protein
MSTNVRDDLRSGWRDAQWAVNFSRALLPCLVVATLLGWIVEGWTTEPGPITWALCMPATLCALFWAGLKEGWNGRLGRYVWTLTLFAVGYWLILALLRSHGSQRRSQVRLAGHAATVTAEVMEGEGRAAGLPRSNISFDTPIAV